MIRKWFEQRKTVMIVLGVVYIILALFLVSSYIGNKANRVLEIRSSISESGEGISESDEKPPLSEYDKSNFEAFVGSITNITNVGSNLSNMFRYFGDYISALGSFTKVYFVIYVILLVLYKPGKEYETIEHGSADWAHGGEEYKVLSKTEGFILAKDHFMPMIPNPPTGKNGNILVIRRFWIW